MKIPEEIKKIFQILAKNKQEAFLVGGSVRDLLMRKNPKDWDITTKAKPEEVQKIFPQGKYLNNFGTVIVPLNGNNKTSISIVEITTYRSEGAYSDKRHPDEVCFEKNLDKDLERRDFTINAMAMDVNNESIVDLFGGKKDLQKKIIRSVGEPLDRFKEDALRMLRAVRFAVQLDFEIEPKTERAILKMSGSIKFVSNERIRYELVAILSSPSPSEGVQLLQKLKLLQYILPELLLGLNMKQNHHHIYTVFKHSILSLQHCPSSDWRVRFASLLHDIGKPASKKLIKGQSTFYNHEYIGERIVRKIMKRLRFSTKDTEKVLLLVRNHMFYYNTDEVTAASVRRLIKKVGRENLQDLIDMRIADRLGSGTPKAKPYKLRHLEYMFERVQNDPVSVKMLKLNGDYMISELDFKPGPEMGAILDCLLSEVIDDPKKNNLEYLIKRAKVLKKENLADLRKIAMEKISAKRKGDDRKMKENFYVK